MTTSKPVAVVRPFMRGPWHDREQCYDVWFPVFGKMRSAVVVIDCPWLVENPHHSMMLTDEEWREWHDEAIRHVEDYRKAGRPSPAAQEVTQ